MKRRITPTYWVHRIHHLSEKQHIILGALGEADGLPLSELHHVVCRDYYGYVPQRYTLRTIDSLTKRRLVTVAKRKYPQIMGVSITKRGREVLQMNDIKHGGAGEACPDGWAASTRRG